MAIAGLTLTAANSQVITQTLPFSYIPNGSQTLTFNQYSGGATIQNVEIILDITKTGGSLFVDNESGSADTGSITQTLTASLSSSDVLLASTTNPANIDIAQDLDAISSTAVDVTATIGDPTDVFTPGGSDVDGQTFTTPVDATASGFVNSLWWSGYAGPSTFDIDVDGLQDTDTSVVGGASTNTSPATLSGTVTINITVPEPSSAVLGGLAVLGFAFRRRR